MGFDDALMANIFVRRTRPRTEAKAALLAQVDAEMAERWGDDLSALDAAMRAKLDAV